jgi:hypothetical protein
MPNDPPANALFRVTSLPLAAFLLTKRRLEFIGCAPTSDHPDRIEFQFSDPAHEGAMLEAQYQTGEECSALVFYNSIKRLRTLMTRVIGPMNKSTDRSTSNDSRHVRY